MRPDRGLRRKLRVLTLTDRMSAFGGAERLAATITIRLDANRFERFFCSTHRQLPGQTFEEELRAAGVRILSLGRGSKAEVWAWRPLMSLLRSERIDVLHCHKFGSNVWGAIFGSLARVPVLIAHEHAGSYEGQPLRRFLDRRLVARRATVFLTVSENARRRLVEVDGVDSGAVRVVPNGIPEMPAAGSRDIRHEFGIPPTSPLIGSVSQLRPEKALDVLVDAVALLLQEFPDLRALVAGRGPEEGRLKQFIASKGLEENIVLLGPRVDIPDILAALDVAVSCSDFEGSPLSIMEYMAASKPIVATAVGGVPDLIHDGAHGILVEHQNPDELAVAIARLLRDPELRARMGENARERQQAHFDLGHMVRRLETLYEELFLGTDRARKERWTATGHRRCDVCR
jgi:glycosyltransferase involved in cell wall biosynthesis